VQESEAMKYFRIVLSAVILFTLTYFCSTYWSDNSKASNLDWYEVIWMLFSVLFTILFSGVMVVLVGVGLYHLSGLNDEP
jgi:hypothetical protein